MIPSAAPTATGSALNRDRNFRTSPIRVKRLTCRAISASDELFLITGWLVSVWNNLPRDIVESFHHFIPFSAQLSQLIQTSLLESLGRIFHNKWAFYLFCHFAKNIKFIACLHCTCVVCILFRSVLSALICLAGSANLPIWIYYFADVFLMISRRPIISGSTADGPIFTTFSPNSRYLVVDYRSDPLFFLSHGN